MAWTAPRQERLQTGVTGSSCRATGGAPLGFSLIKHLGNGCTRKNVVELMKEQNRPSPVLTLTAQQCCHQIGFPQQTLQGSVVAFLIGA